MKFVVSIGSNIGNRRQYLNAAINELNLKFEIYKKSSIYETEAWGKTNQSNFLNCVVVVESDLPPLNFLKKLLVIEKRNGRNRSSEQYEKWGSRTLDLDILYANDQIINLKNLVIPHPQIKNRKFILTPLNEIIPNFKDPKEKTTIKEMFNQCMDKLKVIRV